MRRYLTFALILLAAAGFWAVAAGAGEDSASPEYVVELDNAFGLIEGADLKVDGVRAGKITTMEIDRRTKHALVGFQITKTGFGSLRQDVRCETRPQSLIGEYFIDCIPGKAAQEWDPEKVIPIERTASTVAPDLVNNILRLPYRQRLRIILNELGAGVASRGSDLNAAIRRFSPALRETNRVLARLNRQNVLLRDLAKNADFALKDLAKNKKDLARWVDEAGATATASAQRQSELAEGFRRLPGFLRELTPTMRELGKAAGEQAPALRDLDASAEQLNRFFTQLTPFAEASRDSLDALGDAAVPGTRAAKNALPVVKQLRAFAKPTPEFGKNLAITLEDLDDRKKAVLHMPNMNGGEGYSGLEALIQYVFDQSLAINTYNQDGYLLKVNALVSECSEYPDPEHTKDDAFWEKCYSQLGPNQPGLRGQPDPSPAAVAAEARRERKAARRRKPAALQKLADALTQGGGKPGVRDAAPAIDLSSTLERLFGGGGRPSLPPLGGRGSADVPADTLLGFLLAP